MKHFNKYLLIVLGLFTLSLGSCVKKVLDKEPQDFLTEHDIWNNIDLVKEYVVNNYNALDGWRIKPSEGLAMPSSVSDETYLLFNYSSIWDTNAGKLSPDDMTIFSDTWKDAYKYIENVNEYLENINEVDAPEEVKKGLTGQMLFIRAWEYAKLLNFFGGVPIITKVFGLNDDFDIERDSYQKGVDWVTHQLDSALTMVPETVSSDDWGRVNKGAVLALKSRVLLYAASKLHDPESEPNGPLYTYDNPDKWQNAADAAKAVIDLGLYSLVEVDNWKDYQLLFLHNSSEVIFAKPYSAEFRQHTPSMDQMNTPNGYHGWSGNCPTQNVVDAFQMKDGQSIDESSLYDPSPGTIYENRELRFYADIVYNGVEYRGRDVEFFQPNGLDSPEGTEGWNYARTGYTLRKFMDESTDFKNDNPITPKIYFRLAGIYLNYAEAEYHLGHEDVARDYVNKIRARVHLPDITSSGKELLEDIRHERRIELVFEGYHRFNDLRRWMLAEDYLSENVKGIEWVKDNGDLTYNIIQNQVRDFKKRMNYLPIPREEIQKSELEQNWNY